MTKAKKAPNKLNNRGIIFIEFDTIGGITLDRVISFAKYPTKILPKANKSKGNVMFKDDS